MWLLDTETEALAPEQFYEPNLPEYAILSHTWAREEVSFQDLARREDLSRKRGWSKIQMTCALARSEGIKYAWVDTCCIDKTSSAELSEAINSMYHWYQEAKICHVALEDFEPKLPEQHDELKALLGTCRWFTRGWTLQELIAPRHMVFHTRDWRVIGTKEELSGTLSSITGIPKSLLKHEKTLVDYVVAIKMSWASERTTTRIEDMAYCMLGLFDINMPLLYGERERAFTRLQEAIVNSTPDPSILAWEPAAEDPVLDFYPPFATSPAVFRNSDRTDISTSYLRDLNLEHWTITSHGLQLGIPIALVKRNIDGKQTLHYFCPLISRNHVWQFMELSMAGPNAYVRRSRKLVTTEDDWDLKRYGLDDLGFWTLAKGISSSRSLAKSRVYLDSGLDTVYGWPYGCWDDAQQQFFNSLVSPGHILLVQDSVNKELKFCIAVWEDDGRAQRGLFRPSDYPQVMSRLWTASRARTLDLMGVFGEDLDTNDLRMELTLSSENSDGLLVVSTHMVTEELGYMEYTLNVTLEKINMTFEKVGARPG